MTTRTRKTTTVAKFITGIIDRHADFGGGEILADLPDTANNRAAVKRVVSEWTQTFGRDGEVIATNKPGAGCKPRDLAVRYRHSPLGTTQSYTLRNFRGSNDHAILRARHARGLDVLILGVFEAK